MSNSHSQSVPTNKTSRPSSFLNGFLSDTPEPAPYASAPEDAKISDRSAFDKQNLSIEEIVSGSGISNLANFPTGQPAPASRTRPPMPLRESAIPLTPPKKFKGHSLASFPDKPQRCATTNTSRPIPKRPQVQPTSYTTGTFSAFRTLSTISQSRRHLSSRPSSERPAPPSKSSTGQTERALRTSQRSLRHAQPVVKPEPLRPTQMSQKQLSENKQYNKMKWRWTSLVVGIPVLLVSTYLLYERLDLADRERKLMNEVEQARLAKRERGVVPGQEREKV